MQGVTESLKLASVAQIIMWNGAAVHREEAEAA